MRLSLSIVVAILICITSHAALADASADLKRASSLLAKAKPAEAIAVLDTAIPAAEQSKDAKLTDLRILLAKCHIVAKDWEKAGAAIDAIAPAKNKVIPPQGGKGRGGVLPGVCGILKGAVLQGQGKSAEALNEIHAALTEASAPIDTVWVTQIIDAIKAGSPKPDAATSEKLADCYRIENGFAKAYPCYEAALKQPGLAPDAGKRMRRWLLKCHLRARQFAKVAKEIDAIVAESPECGPWSYYSLANYYRSKRSYKEALAAYDKLLPSLSRGVAGGEVPPKKLPGPALKTVQIDLVECYTGTKQWDKATELLKSLSTQYPKEAAQWHEAAGAIYQGQKKYPAAIAELKQAIEPKAAVSARKRLGDCYKASLEPKAAAPLIKGLVDKYPDDGPYLPTIAGRMYQDIKDYDKAVALFKFVTERFPDARWQVWDACYYIGECCYAQSETRGQEALTYIKDFYAKHPDRPMDFAIAYGKTLLFPARDPYAAAGVLSRAITDHPRDGLVREVQRMLVSAYVYSNQTDRAAGMLAALVQSASPAEKPKSAIMLGDHYVSSGKYREAAAVFRAIPSLPKCSDDIKARAGCRLGVCYYRSNMLGAARRALQGVTQRYPNTEAAKEALAMLYLWDNLPRASN